MIGPLEIWYIRHGESKAQNIDRDVRAHSGTPNIRYGLSEDGRGQAGITGTWMREHLPKPAALLFSDFERAKETAHCLGYGRRVYREEHAMLAEQDFGLWYVNTEKEMGERYPDEMRRRNALTKDIGVYPSFHWQPLGGVSARQLEMRAWILWQDLCQRFAGQKVALVSHGTFGAVFTKMLLRLSAGYYEENFYEWLHPDNASVRIFRRPGRGSHELMSHDRKTDYIVPWKLDRPPDSTDD
jgi:broad specificity phosphatase PhoE